MNRRFQFIMLLAVLSSQFFSQAIAQDKAFREDFSSHELGASPPSIKTNGATIIAQPPGQAGKWLSVKNQATYKINHLIPLPANFTIEFDVLAMAEQVKDIPRYVLVLLKTIKQGNIRIIPVFCLNMQPYSFL